MIKPLSKQVLSYYSGVIIFALSHSIAHSQYRFQHFDSKNGLAFNRVGQIKQDSLGYIWIQHPDGLSRFDGYNFKAYKYVPDNPLRSSLNILISGIDINSSGGIFIKESQNNLLQYDWNTDGFIPIKLGLENYVVQDFSIDPNKKNIWIASFQKGLFHIDIATGKMIKYFNHHDNPEVELLQNDINGIKDLGESLLLTTLKGLWLFDKVTRNFTRPTFQPEDTAWFYNRSFGQIKYKSNDTLWLAYWYGSKIDEKTKYPSPFDPAEGPDYGFVKISTLFSVLDKFKSPKNINMGSWDIDDQDVFWFGNSGQGLTRFDRKENSVISIKHDPADPNSLISNIVNSIMLDKEGNVWIGTNTGLSLLRKKSLTFHNSRLGSGVQGSLLYQSRGKELIVIGKQRNSTPPTPESLNDILTAPIGQHGTSITFRAELTPIAGYAIGKFWQGEKYLWVSVRGSGVYGFETAGEKGFINPNPTKSFKVIPANRNSISHRLVTAVYEDYSSDLWVGTKTNGLDWISGTLEYGGEGSVINFRHSESDTNSIQHNCIVSLFPENKTSFWVVTLTGLDLFHWDKRSRTGRFQHVFANREPPIVVHRTSDSTILLGTVNGLYQIIKTSGTFKVDRNLLWNKSGVKAIQEDRRGRLWLYGSSGLIFYDRKSKTGIEFTSSDGLEHVHGFEPGGMHQSKDGLIFLFDSEGISFFNPEAFQPSQIEICPALTGLIINNHRLSGKNCTENDSYSISSDISVLNELIIDYQHNNFTIEFSALEMAAPEKNLYRHTLEGYDNDWIETDYKNRIATYNNLPSGTYTFHVKASNHHGVWSDNERVLKVIILPPPWRTWWAYTGYGLLVAGLLVWARRNIVKQERLAASLQIAKVEQQKEHFELEKAKEVDKVKTSFFTNISHEFRTPLTLIKGPAQDLLEKYKSDPKTQEKLKLIQHNSDLLLKLINQLLDLAKLESGSLKVEKTEGEIFSLIRAITSSFESLSRQKGVSIHGDVPAEDCVALFDKDRVETILINLINNAIKFTPSDGSVSVIAWVNENQLHLSVKDTGIGIPKDQQTKIFERFHQVSEAHKEVGTGIGLALVKELVALMGGGISVTSEVGKGSEFKVLLPVELVAGDELRVKSPEQSTIEPQFIKGVIQPETRNPELATILVVEDNTDLREFIIDSLGSEFHFLEAENGEQGLDITTREVPDLIVSDVMMPEMDGITMTERVKKDIRSCHIPIILLTAKSTEESKIHGLECGADDYLTKPFNRNELLFKVTNGVTRQRKLRERLRADLMSIAPRVEVLSEDEKFLNSVKEKILDRLGDEQLSVESLADDLGMSRVQLYRKISGLTDISVNVLIRKLRLQRASQLLQQNWGPVSQVAYEVGFSNLSYFSKVFKEEFGVLPSEYEGKV